MNAADEPDDGVLRVPGIKGDDRTTDAAIAVERQTENPPATSITLRLEFDTGEEPAVDLSPAVALMLSHRLRAQAQAVEIDDPGRSKPGN